MIDTKININLRSSIIFTILLIVFKTTFFSQNIITERLDNYNDVLVIINQNSSLSDSIGQYFAHSRNIPFQNIIYIDAPTTEEIDSNAFNSIRMQIENYLIANSLVDRINYIVTTKGVPLKVNRGNTFSPTSPSSSVESELTLILGPYADKIGKKGFVVSPYFLRMDKFSRSQYGIYLVTRLDGYTFSDVKNLIDKSRYYVWIDSSKQFIFDQDPNWNSTNPFLNNLLSYAHTKLSEKGLNSYLDNTNVFLTNRNDVIGYVSFGSNDYNANQYTIYARPNNTWANGAIAETYVSTSGRTFTRPVTYGQSVIADLIAEGITGAKGYVYEPYSNAMAIVWFLFDMYTEGYNLAESYYASSRALSWMDVIVGDPKMRIFIPKTKLSEILAYRFGNEMNVKIEWKTDKEYKISKFFIEKSRGAIGIEQGNWKIIGILEGNGTTVLPRFYSFTDRYARTGDYYYRIRIKDSLGNEIVSNPVTVNEIRHIDFFTENKIVKNDSPDHLLQTFPNNVFLLNFPNPFNPSTDIKFYIKYNQNIKLRIYNSLGHEIAVLHDGYISSGLHSIKFDASKLSSGMYISVLETEENIYSNKLLLVK